MQFDLLVPPGITNAASAQASNAAALAGKQAIYSVVGPGQVRVVIAGLNQSALQEGEVATLYLGPAGEGQAAPSAWLSSPVLASPAGERVPVESNDSPDEGEVEEDEGEVAEDPAVTPEGEADPVDDDDPKSAEGEPATDDEGTGGGRSLNPYYPGGVGGGSGNFDDSRTSKANDKKTSRAARTQTAANAAAAAKGSKPGSNLYPQPAPYLDPGAPSKGKAAPQPGGQFGPIPFGKTASSELPADPTRAPAPAPPQAFPTQLAQNATPSELPPIPAIAFTNTSSGASGGGPSGMLSTSGASYWYLILPLTALTVLVVVVLRTGEHVLVATLRKRKKKSGHRKRPWNLRD